MIENAGALHVDKGKKTIAFYLNNSDIDAINFRDVDKGNPGVGGTEFQIYRIAKLLETQSDLYAPVILTSSPTDPNLRGLTEICVGGIDDAASFCKANRIDLIFFRSECVPQKPRGCHTKFATIFHNEPDPYEMMRFAKRQDIDALVFLTKQESFGCACYRMVREKSYVCPLIPAPALDQCPDRSDVRKVVCFVGSLVPSKGAHVLCEVWPRIKAKVADAELWIIGSASLWGNHFKMGPKGLAEAGYEKRLFETIGTYEDSVRFFGKLSGQELEELYSNISVGVPKLTNEPESFCLAAVDFERNAIPVVTMKKSAFIETVAEKAGIRFTTRDELVTAIARLLQDDCLNIRMGKEGFLHYLSNYSINAALPKWLSCIDNILSGGRGSLRFTMRQVLRSCLMVTRYKLMRWKALLSSQG